MYRFLIKLFFTEKRVVQKFSRIVKNRSNMFACVDGGGGGGRGRVSSGELSFMCYG